MQRNDHSLVVSKENQNHMQRWDFQNKIENALIHLDSHSASKLELAHIIFTDANGVKHDYYLEILDETSKGSDRNYCY